jgi:hypothetical protein
MQCRMDSFFKTLGDTVLQRWKAENYSLAAFPGIAQQAIDARPPAEHVDLDALRRDFLLSDDQPLQSQSGFGQPELIAFDHPRFYIQLLFWLDGTTEIHQHEFSGAFHVMSGSSIHAHYGFDNERSITPHLMLGDVRMKKIELLETGSTVPIISGRRCIHSLFHLDTPSVTVVVRTHNDPGTGPQFNYLPPHLAINPDYADTLTMRRKQLIDVLEAIQAPDYAALIGKMIAGTDFESGFYILQHSMATLIALGAWDATVAGFKRKHGALADGIEPTLTMALHRYNITELRRSIVEPEHRFFLALLMNAPTKGDVLALIQQRYPEDPAAAVVMHWVEQLAGMGEDGVVLLDAEFPLDLGIDPDDQGDMFMTALAAMIEGSKKAPKGITVTQMKAMREALSRSSLAVLVQ